MFQKKEMSPKDRISGKPSIFKNSEDDTAYRNFDERRVTLNSELNLDGDEDFKDDDM